MEKERINKKGERPSVCVCVREREKESERERVVEEICGFARVLFQRFISTINFINKPTKHLKLEIKSFRGKNKK